MTATAAANMNDVLTWGWHFACVWLVGLVLGWLLPKPKWVDRGLKAKALLLSTPPGLWFRRVALAAHLSLIIREVWRNLFAPGTFRGVLRSLWLTVTTGAPFEWPRPTSTSTSAAPASLALAEAEAVAPPVVDDWYIGEKDLEEFKWTLDHNGRPSGASEWELMMEKQWPGCTYTAWRRTLPSGKSEYKSVTIAEDATAEEFMDFYLDDETRMTWDGMISETQLLETGGEPTRRQQVVRWLRTFPFAFISQREYVIARRFFRGADGSLYALSRGLESHPAAPEVEGRVRMLGFHSHWRSRTVACPHGSGRPAVETVLLHYEDFRINERLAKFAVRHGMAGFVKGMVPAVRKFVEERRSRVDPYAEDPQSFGRRTLATPVAAPAPVTGARGVALISRCASEASNASFSSDAGSYSLDDSASDRSVGRAVPRSASMRRLGAMMLASGVAIALARTASVNSLAPPTPGGDARHGGRRHGQQQHGRQHGRSSQRQHGHRRRRMHEQERVPSPEPEPAVLAVMAQS